MIIFMLPDSVELFEEFRRGYVLSISAGGEVLRFNLTDTSKMLASLLACAKEQGEPTVATAPNRSNFLPEQHTSSASKELITPESRVEAITVATNILSAARISAFQFAQPTDVPEMSRVHDAVWLAGDLIGTIRVLAGARSFSVSQIRSAIISTDSEACKGRFASGSMPVAGDRDDAIALFTACEDSKGKTANYILVPRPKGGHYLFSLYGEQKSSEALSSATAKVREASFNLIK